MGIIHELSQDVFLPEMIKIKQKFSSDHLTADEIPEVIDKQLGQNKFKDSISAGKRICITCGSRGISNIALITKSMVDFCNRKGAKPFVVPAMGSHGGATAEGQLELLESYGVTEEYLGCPIYSSMETVKIGKNEEGTDVFIDRFAYEADGIIVCGRVKPHTNFRGRYESGLMKMMAIGLGKQYGAAVCHAQGFKQMAKNVILFGRSVLRNAPVICGMAILENPYDKTSRLVALGPDEIESQEPILLEEARGNMPQIMFPFIDLLIVDKIGKNYSGTGMDPNITGRFSDPDMTGSTQVERLVVLDLSDESHGNAVGINGADITTQKLMDKYDREAVYSNAITAALMQGGMVPMIADNDEDAIKIALKMIINGNIENPRVVRISNTLQLEDVYISRALLKEAENHPDIEIIGDSRKLQFDEAGSLL